MSACPKSPQRPTLLQRAVGIFVVWQLWYLAASNLMPLFPHGYRERDEMTDDLTLPGTTTDVRFVQAGIDVTADVAKRYGELTGQMQGWSLFAPGVAHQAAFPVVELRWVAEDGHLDRSVRLASSFEPPDPANYIHWPSSDCRLFNYEFRLTNPLWFWSEENFRAEPKDWREWLMYRVGRQWKSMRAYLTWRMRRYLAEHPGESPPTEVVLLVRLHPIAPPGNAGSATPLPYERPLARWVLPRGAFLGKLPVEVFDPVADQFIEMDFRSVW
jgi:hypothetical protein